MKLTRAEFDSRYADGSLKLALIGMSNIGKSYSALRIAAQEDVSLIEVDQQIWTALGETDMEAFAAWLGQPYSGGYEARERKSIAMETDATRACLSIEARNPLLDTTGSVIYTESDVQSELRRDWYIVYIKAVPDHLDRLLSQYFAQPKPLSWNGHYERAPGQSEQDALLSSYPTLLASRDAAYAALADHTVMSDAILTPDSSALFELFKPPA